MMVPDDSGMIAFHGDAELKVKVLERMQWYEAQGDAGLKMGLLQELWNRGAQYGIILDPYPRIARMEDIAGLCISGDVSTLYALGAIDRHLLLLLDGGSEQRIYVAGYSVDNAFNTLLGVPPTLVSVLKAVSKGLTPERQIPWLKQFWATVPVGASLWQAPMRLVLWALSDPTYGIPGRNDAGAQVNESDTALKAVRDILALYRRWSAGDKAEPRDWFSFYTHAEDTVKSGRRRGDDGKLVNDLPAPERCCLLAAACAARSASVEETIVTPLPAGTIAIQISGDNLHAPGDAIYHAGMYASDRGIVPGDWYEACASVLLSILADCLVPARPAQRIR